MKRKTDKEIRAMFRRMNAPGSPLRELADWHRRDGEGPVPQAVKDVVRAMRNIPKKVREEARKRIAKMRD